MSLNTDWTWQAIDNDAPIAVLEKERAKMLDADGIPCTAYHAWAVALLDVRINALRAKDGTCTLAF